MFRVRRNKSKNEKFKAFALNACPRRAGGIWKDCACAFCARKSQRSGDGTRITRIGRMRTDFHFFCSSSIQATISVREGGGMAYRNSSRRGTKAQRLVLSDFWHKNEAHAIPMQPRSIETPRFPLISFLPAGVIAGYGGNRNLM